MKIIIFFITAFYFSANCLASNLLTKYRLDNGSWSEDCASEKAVLLVTKTDGNSSVTHLYYKKELVGEHKLISIEEDGVDVKTNWVKLKRVMNVKTFKTNIETQITTISVISPQLNQIQTIDSYDNKSNRKYVVAGEIIKNNADGSSELAKVKVKPIYRCN